MGTPHGSQESSVRSHSGNLTKGQCDCTFDPTLAHEVPPEAACLRFTSIAICVLSLLTTVAAAANDGNSKQRLTITSACEYDYPPFCVVGPGLQADGFSIELIRAAAGAMNADISFKVDHWAEVKGMLERGEIQALPLVGRTPEREHVFDFTFPYLSLHGAIVVRKDTVGISDLNDLAGQRVAVMEGDNAEEFLRQSQRPFTITTTETFEDALHHLSEGKCDAVVIQRLLALRLLQELRLTNLKVVKKPLNEFRQDFCFAVREGDKETLSLLNEGLAVVMADGTFRHLQAKWFAPLELPSAGPVIIGGRQAFPPYEFLDENGQPTGYNVELTLAIAEAVGLDVQIQLGPWPLIKSRLLTGEVDAVPGMPYSPGREAYYDFSQPHTAVDHVAVIRQGDGTPPLNISALTGKRLVIAQDDLMHDWAIEHGLGDNTETVASQAVALTELSCGKHDCALVARLPALHWIKINNCKNLVVASKPLLTSEYCYAVKGDHTVLLARISDGLKTLHDSGEYQRIYKKWLGVYERKTPSVTTVARYVALFVAPLLLILGVVVLWSRTLHQEVSRRTSELAESEKQLEEANQIMSATLNHTHIMVVLLDPSFDFIWVNKSYADTCGHETSFFPGKNHFDLYPNQENQEIFQNVVATGQPFFVVAKPFKFPDQPERGNTFWDWSLIPIKDHAGAVTALVFTLANVTERIKTEEDLRSTTTFLNTVVEKSPFAMWVADPRGNVVRTNNALCRTLNLKNEQIVGHYNVLLDKNLEISQLMPQVRNVFEKSQAARFTMFWGPEHAGNVEFGNASRISIDVSLFPILDGDGNLSHVVCQWLDITDRVQAETNLRNARNFIANIIDSMPSVLIGVDGNGTVTQWNKKSEQLTGVSRQDAVGSPLEHVFPRIAPDMERVRQAMETQRVLRDSKRYFEHEEEARYEQLTVYPLITNTMEGAVILLDDITDRVRIDELLIQSEKMMSVGGLAAGMAHEINNPLGGIIQGAQNIERRLSLELDGNESTAVECGTNLNAIREYLDKRQIFTFLQGIRECGSRAADIVRTMLKFSRRSSAKVSKTNISELVDNAVKLAEQDYDLKKKYDFRYVRIIRDLKPNLPPLPVVETEIEQVFLNILKNSAQALHNNPPAKPPTITIRGMVDGPTLLVEFEDNGTGMTEEVRKRVFEPFFTTKEVGSGTGLGLSVSYMIVTQNHSGQMTVESTPNEGTTFAIRLPIHLGSDNIPSHTPSTASFVP